MPNLSIRPNQTCRKSATTTQRKEVCETWVVTLRFLHFCCDLRIYVACRIRLYIGADVACSQFFFHFNSWSCEDPWVFNFLSMLSLAFVSDMWYRQTLTFSKQNYGPSHDLAVCTLLRCSCSSTRLNSACNIVLFSPFLLYHQSC